MCVDRAPRGGKASLTSISTSKKVYPVKRLRRTKMETQELDWMQAAASAWRGKRREEGGTKGRGHREWRGGSERER